MIETKFKQTEIGLIPEDWNVYKISDIAAVTTGNRNTQDRCPGGKYPFYVRSQEIERINSYSFDTEGVITAGDGVGTGKVYHYVNGKFELHQRAYLIYAFNGISPKYFYKYFSQNFYERVSSMTAKSSVDSVRKEMITDMQIAVPQSLAEQQRIASALTSVDNLLSSLDKLIAKKRDIKQGAMQQLLTGKTRLKGFTEPWEENSLGNLVYIYDGTHQTPHYVNNGIPFYSVENVSANNFTETKYISLKEHLLISKNKKIERGDILMTRIGSIGVCKYVDWDADASFYVSLALLKRKGNIDMSFLSYASNTKRFKGSILLNSLLFAIPLKINLGAISNVTVLLPPTIEEQQAIAAILSSIDSDIAALEAKRKKYEAVKQGMMQQLLTGKIRLIAPCKK